MTKQPPITSLSLTLTIPTIDLKAGHTPVLPQATTIHPSVVGTGFSFPKKHTCC